MDTLQVPYGEGHIEFFLDRRDRKTMSITVTPALEVEVIAPFNASLDHIFEKVRKRAPWIKKQLSFFSQFQPRTPERKFISGETHLYLGRQYKLKVTPNIIEGVKLYRGRIIIQSHKPSQENITKSLLNNWYRERARVKFPERVNRCLNLFPSPADFEPSSLEVRQLKQRWGSMTPRGRLILNLSLIRASVDSIEYVITHELCHIAHQHHGRDFYALLDRVMPDWEERKAKLERQLA
ncbi:M48 family metallopeptidase [Billgrantia sp. LNSP4103-1]|uniref:M48 family metallopeptidase n=1 Tax=Billgrantia sp. LNSP4103-1 TaxID=3410266 RepID=UPI00403F592C